MKFERGAAGGCLLLCVASVQAHSSFTIDSWRMTNLVSTPEDIEGGVSAVVRNPLRQTFEAALGQSRAVMALDFSWDCREGNFLIDVSYETEDIAIGSNRSSTSGQMVLTPLGGQGVQLTLEGEYTYWAPSSGFLIDLTLSVTNVGISSMYYFSRHGGPAVLEPPAGMLAGGTTLFLPADGARYRINFSMHSDTYQSGMSIIATGDGHVTIRLEAIGFSTGDATT